MFSKQTRTETVTLGALLNENRTEEMVWNSPRLFVSDWLVFQIKTNASHVRTLEIRQTPLKPGEKLFVVGWTNSQKEGPQRTYEYEYYKTVGTHILLKDLVVPANPGGLSGAPVVDENGSLLGIVSDWTVDPDTGKRFFLPCVVTGLAAFLDNILAEKTPSDVGKLFSDA
jgi:hypothetical protein